MAGDLDGVFTALGRSAFRSRFRLRDRKKQYFQAKGMGTIPGHARNFVVRRLVDAEPMNDGRRTPMRNHPVFVARYATGTCCRGCLETWHDIPRERKLTEGEIDYVVEVIGRWLEKGGLG